MAFIYDYNTFVDDYFSKCAVFFTYFANYRNESVSFF